MIAGFLLFPAYAGVIPRPRRDVFAGWAFPRIRGGDPYELDHANDRDPFSPHTRG